MPSRPTAELIPPGTLTAEEARRHLDAARERLLARTGDLDGERSPGPKLAIVNPPLRELGHVAWFQEHWCPRMRADGTPAPSRLADADRLYDPTTSPWGGERASTVHSNLEGAAPAPVGAYPGRDTPRGCRQHEVLRGGSFATPARLLRTSRRNFYTADRYDVFAGFRTCAA